MSAVPGLGSTLGTFFRYRKLRGIQEGQTRYPMEKILRLGPIYPAEFTYPADRVLATVEQPSALSLLGVLDEIAFYSLKQQRKDAVYVTHALDFRVLANIDSARAAYVTCGIWSDTKGPGITHQYLVNARFEQESEKGDTLVAMGQASYRAIAPRQRTPMEGEARITGDLLADLGISGSHMTVTKNVENNLGGVHGAALAIFVASQAPFIHAHIHFRRPTPTSGVLRTTQQAKEITISDMQDVAYVRAKLR